MILQQLYLGCLSQASYLIADEDSGVAAVVDPRRDIDEYVQLASDKGLKIAHVILTHFHADFISGHVELQEKFGAKIYLGKGAEAEYDFVPLADGDEIQMGTVRLQTLATPGHTPESICVLVFDESKDKEKPHAVCTGDTLFVGDVGRPDLMACVGVTAEQLAGQLFESVHQKLLPLPDETLVYPGHGAGSMCGKNLSSETSSTIGQQRQFNYALQPMSKAAFVSMLTANQPAAPAYFAMDAGMNKKQRPSMTQTVDKALRPLPLADFLRLQQAGAQVLDVRDAKAYAHGHLHGSINIGLGGKFATWCGSILDLHQPILILGESGQEEEAISRLGRIGLDNVSGFLEGGMYAVGLHPEIMRHSGRVTVEELDQHLAAKAEPFLLDVRGPAEYEIGAIVGCVHIPLNHLQERMGEVPLDRPVVVYCASGYRSAIAMSLLENGGHLDVVDLIGGQAAWLEAQGPG